MSRQPAQRARSAAVFAVAAVLLVLSFATSEPSAGAPDDVAGSTVSGAVVIDFAGTGASRAAASAAFSVPVGSSAWTALQQAVGPGKVTYIDYGGNLGVMVTGLYGVTAQGNHFWEFVINGESSNTGVSAYVVRDGDRLEFRYAAY